ncbi:hypothetical protein GQ607_013080 [Colletotrichum asianum]|uniref:Uncharacterized protein n=1 Tax=Colletotrichum asianum TaxID=702518 RepID=A0A8H3W5A9_9PEZI|nr:hypothetical protein GQ607_013080 [Colletotrichum asianum]
MLSSVISRSINKLPASKISTLLLDHINILPSSCISRIPLASCVHNLSPSCTKTVLYSRMTIQRPSSANGRLTCSNNIPLIGKFNNHMSWTRLLLTCCPWTFARSLGQGCHSPQAPIHKLADAQDFELLPHIDEFQAIGTRLPIRGFTRSSCGPNHIHLATSPFTHYFFSSYCSSPTPFYYFLQPPLHACTSFRSEIPIAQYHQPTLEGSLKRYEKLVGKLAYCEDLDSAWAWEDVCLQDVANRRGQLHRESAGIESVLATFDICNGRLIPSSLWHGSLAKGLSIFLLLYFS